MLDPGPFPGRLARFYRGCVVAASVAGAVVPVLATAEGGDAGIDGWLWGVDRGAALVLVIDWLLQFSFALSMRPAGGGRSTAAMAYLFSLFGIIDSLAALPVVVGVFLPLSPDALVVLGVARFLKLARYLPALDTLGSVVRREARPLQSALYIMGLLMLVSSTALYLAERRINPDAFGSVPRAMWWSVVTLTTLGYGDAIPTSPAGKLLGALTAIFGVGMFALPASILANGFAEEMRRRDFLTTWHMVAKVPFFGALDADQIAGITALLKYDTATAGDVLIRAGDLGHAMYFIVSGVVEVDFGGAVPALLKDGDFFGEIALLRNTPRTATVKARTRCQLLTLDMKDFRRFLAGSPAIADVIAETAERRLSEQEETADQPS